MLKNKDFLTTSKKNEKPLSWWQTTSLNFISLVAMYHNFNCSSCTSPGCFKSSKWLLQFEMMSDKRFNIDCSRGNKSQRFGITVSVRWHKKTRQMLVMSSPFRMSRERLIAKHPKDSWKGEKKTTINQKQSTRLGEWYSYGQKGSR